MTKEKLKVLILEDNPFDAELVESELQHEEIEYIATRVGSEKDFRKAIGELRPDLILSDFNLPQYNGFSALQEVRSRGLKTPFIFVSGVIGEEMAIEAFNRGATDCVNKNHLGRLPGAIKRAMAEYSEKSQRLIAEEALALSYERLHSVFMKSVQAMSTALEFRDPYTSGHQQRVADLAVAISKRHGVCENQIEGVYLSGLVHDIGKIYVPAELLMRPVKLTEIEFKMIQVHSQAGYQILKDIDFPWPIAESAYQHHERMDGSGYPQGLKGDEITLESRIIAVADVVEAMASHRPYRAALGIEAALEEIKRGAGTKYDRAIVEACLGVFAEGFSFT